MSQETVEPPEAGVLVRYRYLAGDVNERLTLFEDGAVKLDERRRSRDPIWLRLDAAELGQVRAALNRIPRPLWARGPELALVRIKSTVAGLGKEEFEDYGSFFQLKRGRHSIAGEDPSAADIRVGAVVTLLETLRMRAIRAVPR
jgi:hypothetical protein